MKKKDKNFAKKVATSAIALMCVCGITVGGVLALLHAESEGDKGGLQNTFTSSEGLIEKTTDSIKDPADPTNELQFWLNENEVQLNEKGDYAAIPDEYTKTNEYKDLVAGMTLDKNPKLTVNLRENQRAYVYIIRTKTVSDLQIDKIATSSVFYEIGASKDGKKTLYVYRGKGNGTVSGGVVQVGKAGDIPEIDNVSLMSSEKLPVSAGIEGASDLQLNFDAYVVQSKPYENGKDAKQNAINAFKAAYKDKAAEFGL